MIEGGTGPDLGLGLGLAGRAALVAGAGQGIGRATALLLAGAGARVACMDVDAGRRDAVVEELLGAGGEAVAVPGDLLRREQVDAAVAATTDAFGGLDVAVDIVGVARWNAALDLTDEDWDQSFDLVLRHVFFLAQAAGRVMVEQAEARAASQSGRQGGSIVSIASVSGLFAAPGHAAYGAAKAGLISLTKSFAVELAPHGVRVNAVAPGAVRTPRVLERLTPEREAASSNSIPMGRMAEPEDVAKAVLFFCSDLSAYVTGQTLVVDGGASVKFPLSLGG